jgi:hypothetical protein
MLFLRGGGCGLFVGWGGVCWFGGVERKRRVVGWMDGLQIPEHIKYVMSTWALFA